MSTKFPGGLVRSSGPTIVGPTNQGYGLEGGSAPGIWTLEQASYYTKQGVWPLRVKDRLLYAWGNNLYGTLGQNDIVYRSSPVQVGTSVTWSNISMGWYSCLATKTDGTLWAWGYNAQGQLGQNNVIYRSSPVQIGALTTWARISSDGYTSLATKTDGTLWAWGNNSIYGALGLNDRIARSSPVQVGALTTWDKISAGAFISVAVKTDGTLWSWGRNNFGQLGLNDITYRSSPVQVGALTTWLNVSAGWYACLATKTDGTLWVWGKNNQGQLGLNDLVNRSSPVQIGTLTTWSTVGQKMGESTYAIKADGSLWSWGINQYGQLGLNDIVSRSSPVQVGALTTWLNVESGSPTCLATKTDGTLWSWGRNDAGQLGLNDRINRSSPVQIGALATWGAISMNSNEACAIRTS